MSKPLRILAAMAAMAVLAVGAAEAVPAGALHPNNVGITVFGFAFDGTTNTITLRETWGNSGVGIVQLTGLTEGVDYTVVKLITNSSGDTWTSFANELLDPAGSGPDGGDDPIPVFAPAGFTRSNDADGLSFAQGSALPRTSTQFGIVAVDELAGRDFIDFFGGAFNSGEVDLPMTFGLRDFQVANNEPFLLVQRPNERSIDVPYPGSLLLMGGGLAVSALALGLRRAG